MPLIKDAFKNNSESELVVHIEKENILENENILLTVNSYRNDIVSSKFPLIKLVDYVNFKVVVNHQNLNFQKYNWITMIGSFKSGTLMMIKISFIFLKVQKINIVKRTIY